MLISNLFFQLWNKGGVRRVTHRTPQSLKIRPCTKNRVNSIKAWVFLSPRAWNLFWGGGSAEPEIREVKTWTNALNGALTYDVTRWLIIIMYCMYIVLCLWVRERADLKKVVLASSGLFNSKIWSRIKKKCLKSVKRKNYITFF